MSRPEHGVYPPGRVMNFKMNFRKALVVPLLFVSGLGVATAATILSMSDVNLKVAELIKPFNTASTAMNFEFTSLNVDQVRALDFGIKGFLNKKGTLNEVQFDLKDLNYAYGDGTKPTATVDADVKFDLVKFLGQEKMNEFATSIDELVVDAATDFVQEYGAAAKVEAKTVDKVVDAQGNIQLLKMKLTANIDMSLLPATLPEADVEIQSLDVEITASRTGVSLKGNVVLNPKFYPFEENNIGLKEYIDALLSDDEATYDDVNRYLAIVDGVATWLVEESFE